MVGNAQNKVKCQKVLKEVPWHYMHLADGSTGNVGPGPSDRELSCWDGQVSPEGPGMGAHGGSEIKSQGRKGLQRTPNGEIVKPALVSSAAAQLLAVSHVGRTAESTFSWRKFTVVWGCLKTTDLILHSYCWWGNWGRSKGSPTLVQPKLQILTWAKLVAVTEHPLLGKTHTVGRVTAGMCWCAVCCLGLPSRWTGTSLSQLESCWTVLAEGRSSPETGNNAPPCGWRWSQ